MASASTPSAVDSISSQIAAPPDFEFHGTALDLWWRYWVTQLAFMLAFVAAFAVPYFVLKALALVPSSLTAVTSLGSVWTQLMPMVLGLILGLSAFLCPCAFLIAWQLQWFVGSVSCRGERLEFRGTGADLLLWMLLAPCFVFFTLGCGAVFLPYLFTRWCITNTYFRNERYRFQGDFAEWYGVTFIYLVFPMIVLLPLSFIFSLLFAAVFILFLPVPFLGVLLWLSWGVKRFNMWMCKNTYVGGRQLRFTGDVLPLFGWTLLNLVATPAHIVTLNFTACLIGLQIVKWSVRGNRFAGAAEATAFVPQYEATPAAQLPDVGVAEAELPIRRAQVREAIADAESNQDWNLLVELCDRYRALAPDEEHIVEKLKSARRNRDGAFRWREAQEASAKQEWRAAEKALAQYLDLFPDNKKAREVHEQTVRQIERVAGAARAKLLEPLSRRQPGEALTAAKSLPSWLCEELPVAQVIQAATDLEKADGRLRKGRWASAASLLGRWAGTNECPWIAEWLQHAKDRLAALRRSYRKRTTILAAGIALVGLTLLGLAEFVFLDTTVFIVGLGVAGAAPVVFAIGWLLASVVSGARAGEARFRVSRRQARKKSSQGMLATGDKGAECGRWEVGEGRPGRRTL
jgi:hypothetical protein